MASLTLAWGCSSDSSDENGSSRATFSPVASAPDWHVDLTWHDTAPDWQDPSSTQFECSMNLLVELGHQLVPFSSPGDQMAMFINGECRGVSYRNVTDDGTVVFLLHVKGTSEESSQPMQIRYYSAGASQLFINDEVPTFTPNNLMEEAFQLVFDPQTTSTKYPELTELTVYLPAELPFNVSEDDRLAVFVGNECRGVMVDGGELYPGWKGDVYGLQQGEKAQLRYYSAEKGGVYVFSEEVTLNGNLLGVSVTF